MAQALAMAQAPWTSRQARHVFSTTSIPCPPSSSPDQLSARQARVGSIATEVCGGGGGGGGGGGLIPFPFVSLGPSSTAKGMQRRHSQQWGPYNKLFGVFGVASLSVPAQGSPSCHWIWSWDSNVSTTRQAALPARDPSAMLPWSGSLNQIWPVSAASYLVLRLAVRQKSGGGCCEKLQPPIIAHDTRCSTGYRGQTSQPHFQGPTWKLSTQTIIAPAMLHLDLLWGLS
ncbi:hypothetical protein CCUS01_13851 [Colletotrichum cuscutae]|uniref:Uncharacterized protein n=1 Tax=Colletotrichum cuscutae TaxID=1209917 RepID=A0AAI9YAH3_9PEZI|nr:hypothetical protein CCUS01_13851 [Colletotrichum cuscutae]